MKLSRECRYAIVGLSVLASKPPGTVLGLGALAEEASLPAPFLAKIFHKLARHGILTSFRGRRRGYALARPAGEITMRHVLEAVDGHELFDRCIFVSESCNSGDPCPLHDAWIPVMNSATSAMSKLTLADIDYTSMQG